MIEVAWKAAARTAPSPASSPLVSSSTSSSAVAASRKPAYSRTSSSRPSSRAGRRRTRTLKRRRKLSPATIITTTRIHCEIGAKAATDSPCGEKPPSAIAEEACANACHGVIASSSPTRPTNASTAVATSVSPT